MIYLALALAPIFFLFAYIYLMDKYEREPLQYLIISFILGVFISFPVVYLGERLQLITGTSTRSSPLGLFVYAFFVVAFTEEFMKFLVLRLYNYPHQEFDEPYDGIMYGGAISLGFAAIENVFYVFANKGSEIEVGFSRMFTAVPAHAMFGVIMGYYVGKAKFLVKGNRTLELCKGLGMAVLLHGLYDYFLFLGEAFLVPLAILILFIGYKLARKAIKDHQDISPHRFES